jgi:hypothetical protein
VIEVFEPDEELIYRFHLRKAHGMTLRRGNAHAVCLGEMDVRSSCENNDKMQQLNKRRLLHYGKLLLHSCCISFLLS